MRIYISIFIAVSMAMLTLPLLFVDLSSDRVSVQENRMLARLPMLVDIKKHPKTFIRDFDAWFKDSIGFRKQLLIPYNAMSRNKWYNGVLYKDGQYLVVIGKQGHYYAAGINGRWIGMFQGKQFLTDDQLSNMAPKLEEVKTYLDNKGTPLIVMFGVRKETIYPEFYPKSIKRGNEPIQLDIMTRYLQEHTTVDVFNIRQALLAEKNNFMLYGVSPPNDFGHYNQIGGFFAYRELMRYINIYFPEIISYELHDVNIRYDDKKMPDVSLKQEKLYKELDPSFFDDVSVVYRPFSWENVAFENIDYSLPTILFLRDSFSQEQYIGKYIAQHFGKTIMIHYLSIEHLEEYIDRYKPDIVVFESADIELFADCVAEIPELPLSK